MPVRGQMHPGSFVQRVVRGVGIDAAGEGSEALDLHLESSHTAQATLERQQGGFEIADHVFLVLRGDARRSNVEQRGGRSFSAGRPPSRPKPLSNANRVASRSQIMFFSFSAEMRGGQTWNSGGAARSKTMLPARPDRSRRSRPPRFRRARRART